MLQKPHCEKLRSITSTIISTSNQMIQSTINEKSHVCFYDTTRDYW